ncbi:MAG: nuclear transport factor 2 family protein [Rhodospirillaceae bacterium]|jgi:ketosteroid isomerase-like protein|nr:nuclear transport factor 2 family protein [Rhodospirillaceae bacterium]MBT6204643.1 nuclear transport factor 2 family protein [Rhodospirillaceae bacterium]MBT6511121.1 nuclear transport factor 2 family protein [Rhodospirillaceae bacterium]MBT7649034.1 nuclear transport factor 2 family protein [Rhodospirillaceae bacterium]
MSMSSTPKATLLACAQAFNNRDADAVVAMSDAMALFEIPMLKPNRLHGHDEIRRGLQAAFAELGTVAFRLDDPAENGTVAIAEGSLAVTRNSASDKEHYVGIVAETREGALVRFSLYLNARNRRLWSDEAIL